MTKLKVYANPYGHIDHKGRLAGAVLLAEPRRSTAVIPSRQFVGARLAVVSVETLSNHVGPDGERFPRGHGMPQLSRTDSEFIFSDEPVEVDASGSMAAYYAQAFADGTLIEATADGTPPLGALARARQAAIARLKAETGKEPDTSSWERQYSLDLEVVEAMSVLAERDKAAAEKAKDEAEKAKDEAEKAKLKATADAQDAETRTKNAREERMTKARATARKALGVKEPATATPPASTSGKKGASAPEAK